LEFSVCGKEALFALFGVAGLILSLGFCREWCDAKFPMAIGQSKVFAPRPYGVADAAAVPTSPDRGK
jgi:hypothetical protein